MAHRSAGPSSGLTDYSYETRDLPAFPTRVPKAEDSNWMCSGASPTESSDVCFGKGTLYWESALTTFSAS